MRAVVLLRGVNVGGVRFAMKDFAAALEREGFRAVRTVLASGNAIVTADGIDGVADRVHALIADAFGFDVAVVAVPIGVVRDAAAAFPFDRSDDRHAYVVFATDRRALDGLTAEAAGLDPEVERIARGGDVLFWQVLKGRTLDSPFGKRLGRKVAAGSVTTRNLQTLEKVLAGE